MPEVSNEAISIELRDAVNGFSAVEHYEERHIPLHGPEIIYMYEAPQRGVSQGVVCLFKAGAVPAIVMVVEKVGDRVRIKVSRMVENRVELFHGGNMFSNLENNYVDQML